MTSKSLQCEDSTLPKWVPIETRRYLAHIESGESIRAIARAEGCHASTILRQVRRIESRRDDVLVDLALRRLEQLSGKEKARAMKNSAKKVSVGEEGALKDTELRREAPRILRRLNEPGASLAIAKDMEKAVVVRDGGADGQAIRTAIIDRGVAEALAIKDWISLVSEGRVSRYQITGPGRMALKRFLAEEEALRVGMAEGADPFSEQHRDWSRRNASNDTNRKRGIRYNAAESPLLALARRREKNGKPFLSPELVAAGERLREDFELAHIGPRVTQNWDRFLTAGGRGEFSSSGGEGGSSQARERVVAALKELGPGLGDVALRTCCFLEGMERIEQTMGWSARSGKIVLRIALMRLCQHYQTSASSWSPLIG